MFEQLHHGAASDAGGVDDADEVGGGSGMGLAVVAAVVTTHGGQYGLSSAPQRGSLFWFELPR